MKTLVVIPCFNEQDSIANLVKEVVKYGYDYLVINDSSKDNTQKILDEQAFSHLQATQALVLLDEDRRHYAIGDDIELYVTPQEDIVFAQREGVCIQTPQAVLALKRRVEKKKSTI